MRGVLEPARVPMWVLAQVLPWERVSGLPSAVVSALPWVRVSALPLAVVSVLPWASVSPGAPVWAIPRRSSHTKCPSTESSAPRMLHTNHLKGPKRWSHMTHTCPHLSPTTSSTVGLPMMVPALAKQVTVRALGLATRASVWAWVSGSASVQVVLAPAWEWVRV